MKTIYLLIFLIPLIVSCSVNQLSDQNGSLNIFNPKASHEKLNGNIQSMTTIFSEVDGKNEKVILDSNQNVIWYGINLYNGIGDPTFFEEYEYDSNNRVIYSKSTSFNGRGNEKTYKYFDDENKIEWSINENGKSESFVTTMEIKDQEYIYKTHDINNDLTLQSVYNINNLKLSETRNSLNLHYVYDNKNRLISTKQLNGNKVIIEELFQYDNLNNEPIANTSIVYETDSVFEERTYKYDANNNWIKMTKQPFDTTLVKKTIISRNILYY